MSGPTSIAPSFASSSLQLCLLKNVTTYPPPQPIHCWNGCFSQISKSIHIPPPPLKGQNFGALDQKFTKLRKSAKTHLVGAL